MSQFFFVFFVEILAEKLLAQIHYKENSLILLKEVPLEFIYNL